MTYERAHGLIEEYSGEIRYGDLLMRTQDTVDEFLRVNNIDCPPGAVTLLNLHTYFSYLKNPEQEEESLLSELRQFNSAITEEIYLSNHKTTPSIGVEIEVPYEYFPIDSEQRVGSCQDIRQDLKYLGMNIGLDGAFYSKVEFRFPPTNSAKVQSLMVKEFIDMGLISTDARDTYLDRLGRVQPAIASMHINLGLDELLPNANYSNSMVEYLDTLTMLMACGYVNPARIRSRTFDDTWISNAGNSVKEETYGDPINRLELRIFRVVPSDLLSVLFEQVQALAKPLTQNTPSNTILMQKFCVDTAELLNQYDLEPDDLTDDIAKSWEYPSEKVADVIAQETAKFYAPRRVKNLISDARALAAKYLL